MRRLLAYGSAAVTLRHGLIGLDLVSVSGRVDWSGRN